MRKYEVTPLPLMEAYNFSSHLSTAMAGYLASCSQGSFQGPHARAHLYARQNTQQWWASGWLQLPQLGKLKKCIQFCRHRDLGLHITCFCSLTLFYFDLIFICKLAQLRSSEEGCAFFLLSWDRQKDLGNATEINSAKKMQESSSSAFKSQIMANRRLNFSPRVHMHHDSLHTPLMLFLNYCNMP